MKQRLNFILAIALLLSMLGSSFGSIQAADGTYFRCWNGKTFSDETSYNLGCPKRTLIMYVKPDGTGDGSSWANASSLTNALATATGLYTREIWVQQGTYKPSSSDRSASFELLNGVALYGGFFGTETDKLQRDYKGNPTILSGDLNDDDGSNFTNMTENSYHVVVGNNLDATAVLDGFFITGGNAEGDNGGGIKLTSSNPTLRNLIIYKNQANAGGGIYNVSNSNPYIEGIAISNNFAVEGGGGMYSHFSSPKLVNVTFSNNSTTYWGGGMTNYESKATLQNVTFSGNTTAQPNGYSGGMFNVDDTNYPDVAWPTMINSVIANSTGGDCLGQFAYATNNLIEDAYVADPNNTTCQLQDGINQNIVGQDPDFAASVDISFVQLSVMQTVQFAFPPRTETSPTVDSGTDLDITINARCSDYDQMYQKVDKCQMGSVTYSQTVPSSATNATRYVIPGGATSGECDTWANGCNLEYALAIANLNDQIWVKAGTYTPAGTTRNDSFNLKSAVAVYGGFNGSETALDQRDPAANPTILSGDLNGDDVGFTNNDENVYHVVSSNGLDSSALLDGFTITGGNANGSWPDINGGGIYNFEGSPTLSNLIITGNYASNGGGGMINENSGAISLTNVTFSNNSTGTAGGGLINWISENVTLTHTTFSGNTTTGDGGGVANYSSEVEILESTFSGNSASGSNGGALYNSGDSTVYLRSTILANNTTGGDCVGSLYSGTVDDVTYPSYNMIKDADHACGLTSPDANTPDVQGNRIGTDPLLGPLANNGGYTSTFALLASSPAIDHGADTCSETDQRGKPRADGANNDNTWVCDIGAYEYTIAPTVTSSVRANSTPTSKNSVTFTVTFSEYVNGVDASDFSLTSTGTLSGYSITNVSGVGKTYAVTVNTGNNNGTLRLNVLNNGSITDLPGNALASDFNTGETYTVQKALTLYSTGTNDGWILESTETSSAGGTMNSTATTFNLGDDASDKQYRVILHFDTSALPDDASITSAILQLRKQGTSGTNPFSILGALRVDARKLSFGNFALELADFKSTAGKINIAAFNITPVNNWYSGTFTSTGRNYINKTGSTQFRVYFTTDDNNDNGIDIIKFYSGNAGSSARPKLVIQYSVP